MKYLLLLLFPILGKAQETNLLFARGTTPAIQNILNSKADVSKSLMFVNTLPDLRTLLPTQDRVYFLLGRDSIYDGKGGFYRYDSTSTDTVENYYMNVLGSNLSTVGKFKRIFAKTFALPGGILSINAGIKTYYCTGTTNSSGEITINRTVDNTSNGASIFTEIWGTTIMPVAIATGPAEAVQSYPRTAPAVSNKTVTYGFYKANAVTVTVGLLLTPVASIGAGTSVNFIIVGI